MDFGGVEGRVDEAPLACPELSHGRHQALAEEADEAGEVCFGEAVCLGDEDLAYHMRVWDDKAHSRTKRPHPCPLKLLTTCLQEDAHTHSTRDYKKAQAQEWTAAQAAQGAHTQAYSGRWSVVIEDLLRW